MLVRRWARSWTGRLLRISPVSADIEPGRQNGTTAASAHLPLGASPLLLVRRPSASVSPSFGLGQRYARLGSRISPALTHAWLCSCHFSSSRLAFFNSSHSCQTTVLICPSCGISPSLSLISPSAFLLFLSSCHLHAFSPLLLVSSLTLPTHSFSIHILEDIYEHETKRMHLHHFQC